MVNDLLTAMATKNFSFKYFRSAGWDGRVLTHGWVPTHNEH